MSRLIAPNVQIIENGQDAVNAAYQVADYALEGRNQRDQNRTLPFAEIELFSSKGLGGMRIPQEFGGAYVSNKILAQVFRILNKADSSVGQIPQNQISLLHLIDIMGTAQQKRFIFNEILQGKRLANGGPERHTKDTKTLAAALSIENGRYFIDAEKFYSTGSSFAHWLAIKAIHPEGHTVLALVSSQTQGVEITDDWDGFGQRTTSSGTVKLKHAEIDPLLIFDERKLTAAPN